MSSLLSEDEILRSKEYRRFAEEALEPYAARIDREDLLPPEVLEALREHRFLCPNAPVERDGPGLDYVSIGLLLYEMGRASVAVAAVVTVQMMVIRSILRWGSEDQIASVVPAVARGDNLAAFALTEPGIGSNASAIETAARETGSGYTISGRKKWITAGQIADWLLVFAKVPSGPTAFLVHADDPAVARTPIHGMLGQRGAMLAEIELKDCQVPRDRIVGGEGAGIRYVAANALELGRYGVAWMSVGLAQACLDASVKHASERTQFGKKIIDHQLIQRKVTNMATDVAAAKLMCLHVGRLLDAGDLRSATEAARAKYFASRIATDAAAEAVQIHGAIGCSSESAVERYFRDSKILEIIEGTTEVQQVLLSKYTPAIPF